eukprot:11458483-Ditylum_brightwellii.AAC.1
MVKANLHITDYNELVTYYGSLKAVEPKDGNSNRNNNKNNKQKWNRQGNSNNNGSNNNGNKSNGLFKPYPIHGQKHTKDKCHTLKKIIKDEEASFESCSNNNNSGSQCCYNTRLSGSSNNKYNNIQGRDRGGNNGRGYKRSNNLSNSNR